MVVGDSARFVLTVEEGFNRLRWSPELRTISRTDVQATTEAFKAVLSAEKRPLLVHLGALTQIPREARQVYIEETYPTRVAILSTDLVTKSSRRSPTPQ